MTLDVRTEALHALRSRNDSAWSKSKICRGIRLKCSLAARKFATFSGRVEAGAPRSCLAAPPSLYLALGRPSVAQPGRALLSGGRGRRFKSSHSDQYFPQSNQMLRTIPWKVAEANETAICAKMCQRNAP